VFAAEPDVRQPIAMTFDDRGRVWIAEAYEYPIRAPGDKGRDRTWLNGHKCVDLFDPNGKRRGQFGLQIHSGPALEVRFRNLQLEVLSGK
jgi:hypothetical protein